MRRKACIFNIALVLALFFCSISEAVNLNKAIIGKWFKIDGDGREIEFLKDGTVIGVATSGTTVAGNYKFIDGNRIKVDFGRGAHVFNASIDKEGTLILIASEVEKFVTEKEWKKRKLLKENQIKIETERKRKAQEEERKQNEAKIKAKFLLSDLTILDKETKLMWTRNANITGKEMEWDETFNSKFIEQLNEQKFAGYNDWRLPTVEEIETLVNYAKNDRKVTRNINNLFNEIGFKNMEPNFYWASTSTTRASNKSAWFIDMDNGEVVNGYTSNYTGYIWLVRGASSSLR